MSSTAITFLCWVIIFIISDYEVLSFTSLKALNLGITIAAILWLIYFKWAWKWPYISKLLYRPNISGTWLGEFESDWKDENGKQNPPKRFVLVIRQQWFSISIRAFTDLQKTESYVETMIINSLKGTKILAYLYSEKRVGSGDHGARQGAAELDLIENKENKLCFLEGHFWTQAGTRGYVKVKQESSVDYVDSFQQANEQWGESNAWARLKF